jgi:hypothetical protein
MSLRPSAGNMYGFVTHTWNPIKGRCSHACTYCYMRRFGPLKPLRLDEKEMHVDFTAELKKFREDEKSNRDLFVFVGSSCDMFAGDVPGEWIERVLEKCWAAPKGVWFLFQSKNPSRMHDCRFPAGTTLCTTIETNRQYPEFIGRTYSTQLRAVTLGRLGRFDRPDVQRMVTIEPIMDFDLADLVGLLQLARPNQINIGADSRHSGLPEPTPEKLEALIEAAREICTVHLKPNLERLRRKS